MSIVQKNLARNSINFFASNDKTFLSICSKVAELSSSNKIYSQTADYLLLSVEYIQIIVQIILINNELSNEFDSDEISLSNIIHTVAKLMTPSYLIAERNSTFLVSLSFILMSFCMFKYVLFAYILTLAIKKKVTQNIFIKLWAIIFRLQGRFTYMLISSFWIKTIQTFPWDISNPNAFNLIVNILFTVMIVVDFLFSAYLQSSFASILPTKSLLASKSNKLELLALTQKFFNLIIQIIQINFSDVSPAILWVFLTVNVLINIIREKFFFQTLPLYDIKALLWQSFLLSTVTSLSFSYIFSAALASFINITQNFLVIIWIICALPITKISQLYIIKSGFKLLTNRDNKASPELILHKLSFIKETMQKSQLPNDLSRYYTYAYLLNSSIIANYKKVFSIQRNLPSLCLADIKQLDLDKLILVCLEESINIFPKSSLLKLCLARYYIKTFKLYAPGMRLLTELQNSSNFQTSLNALLIINEEQSLIMNRYKRYDKILDLPKYTTSLGFVSELKNEMIDQAQLQIDLYQETTKKDPNLFKMLSYAAKIHRKKYQIESKMKILPETIHESYLEPFIICAHYSLTLNHSLEQFIKYRNTYNWKHRKYQKYFSADMLCEENLYQEKNIFVIVSGAKGNEGIIMSSPKSLDKLFGRALNGSHLSSLGVPPLQKFFYNSINLLISQGNAEILDNIDIEFCYHNDGYMLPVCSTITIFPFFTQGLNYLGIYRPILANQDYILINTEGNIQGVTKGVGEKLGLLPECLSSLKSGILRIGAISKNLENANKAYNVILSGKVDRIENSQIGTTNLIEDFESISPVYPAKDMIKDAPISISDTQTLQIRNVEPYYNLNMEMEEAKKLVSVFSSEGQTLELLPMRLFQKENSKRSLPPSLTYHCKMENKSYGPLNLRLIILEESKRKLNEISQPKIEIPSIHKPITVTLVSPEDSQFSSPHFSKKKSSSIIERKPLFQNILSFPVGDINNDDSLRPSSERNLMKNSTFFNGTRPGEDNELKIDSERPVSKQIILIEPKNSSKLIGSLNVMTKEGLDTKDEIKQVKKKLENIFDDKESHTQQSSKFTQVKITKAFEDAVTTKYYPASFKFFLLSIYLTFFTIFVNQIVLRILITDNTTNLEARKNFLRLAESRNDVLINVQRRSRILWNFATGFQNDSDYAAIGTARAFINSLTNDVNQLITANRGLLNATSFLDNESRSKLFQQDVRVYETYYNTPEERYTNLTNFQATARIIESSLGTILNGPKNLPSSRSDLEIALRNCVNDLLLRSESTADIFKNSLYTQKQQTVDTILIDFIFILVFLIGIIFAFCGIIVIQYRDLKRKMMAFIKISPDGIKNVSESVFQFKKIVQSQEDHINLQNTKEIDILEYFDRYRTMRSRDQNLKGRNIPNPDDKQLSRKFLLYILNLSLLILLAVGLISQDYHTKIQFVNSLTHITNQLHYSDRMKARFDLAVTSSFELVSENGTTLVQNRLTSSEFENNIKDLAVIRNSIPDVFKNEDSTYNPLVEELLFGEACSYLTGSLQRYCQVLSRGSHNSGLIALISGLEDSLEDFNHKYQISNKSSDSLSDLAVETYFNIMVPELALVNLANQISNNFDSTLTDCLLDGKYQSDVYTYLICVLSLILCILAHLGVLNKAKETENQFKRLLKTLPANLVLSNYILKSYLIKTARGAFDGIRKDL